MGTSVLNVTTSSGHLIRAYAHSTPSSEHGDKKTKNHVTLMMLNFNSGPAEVSPSLGGHPSCLARKTARKFTLEAGPNSAVLLNGNRLAFASQEATTLPPLVGVPSGCRTVKLLPLSATWLVV
jgi:hypothetical protein